VFHIQARIEIWLCSFYPVSEKAINFLLFNRIRDLSHAADCILHCSELMLIVCSLLAVLSRFLQSCIHISAHFMPRITVAIFQVVSRRIRTKEARVHSQKSRHLVCDGEFGIGASISLRTLGFSSQLLFQRSSIICLQEIVKYYHFLLWYCGTPSCPNNN
jgi:hypothetical protein